LAVYIASCVGNRMLRPSISFLTFLILVLILIEPVYAQQSVSEYGIFDATADWGYGSEFPPKRGEKKIPGRMNIIYENSDPIYENFR
jgi:hypothetical protein